MTGVYDHPQETPTPASVAEPWSGPVDLTNCDREPVQFPGAIQPHGVMLLLSPSDFRILGVSANTTLWLGCDPEELLGGCLDRILAPDAGRRLEDALAGIAESVAPRYLGGYPTLPGDDRLDAFAHRCGAFLILELEAIPAGAAPCWPTERFAAVADAAAQLRSAATWQDGIAIAVRELKRLSGFDSVLGVRFLADGSGLAVAEARNDRIPSFLDMRFPRADIPEPARRQMALMRLQYAPALDYEPVPLVMSEPGADPAAIDLGRSLLRSLSPMCNRFYLNMGTRARLVLPLLSHGELWGFLVCWNATPRYLCYCDRLACRSLADLAGLLLAEQRKAEQQGLTLAAKRRIAQVAAKMSAADNLAIAWCELPRRLLDNLDLAGVALAVDGRVLSAGRVPPAAMIKSLLPWLDQQDQPLATDRLPTLFAPAAHSESATGLIALRLLGPGQYLLCFRPEWVHEVRWAGDPRKPIEIDLTSGEQRLTPRGSFEVWKEVVRGLARPWLPHETEALSDLQGTLVLAQHADQQRVLSRQLESSNAELESFAYVVSHDLQEPLRGIRNFSQFLLERTGERLAGQERAWLDTILKLTVRMTAQIDALLQYSRAGQQPLAVEQVDLNALLRCVMDALSGRIGETGAKITVPAMLPWVACDPVRTAAVFENLIANAIKYNDQAEKRVEIGYRADVEPTFFVRDNGIGIAERHREAIFTIFRRLHGREEYGGGTGAGLTIARKHIERQGGRLWLESTPGQGSTFYFTLGLGTDVTVEPPYPTLPRQGGERIWPLASEVMYDV